MAGRRVDDAGALLERDVVGQHAQRVAVVQRVPEVQPLESLARNARERLAEVLLRRGAHAPGQFLGHQDDGASRAS